MSSSLTSNSFDNQLLPPDSSYRNKDLFMCTKCKDIQFNSWNEFENHHTKHVVDYTFAKLPVVKLKQIVIYPIKESSKVSQPRASSSASSCSKQSEQSQPNQMACESSSGLVESSQLKLAVTEDLLTCPGSCERSTPTNSPGSTQTELPEILDSSSVLNPVVNASTDSVVLDAAFIEKLGEEINFLNQPTSKTKASSTILSEILALSSEDVASCKLPPSADIQVQPCSPNTVAIDDDNMLWGRLTTAPTIEASDDSTKKQLPPVRSIDKTQQAEVEKDPASLKTNVSALTKEVTLPKSKGQLRLVPFESLLSPSVVHLDANDVEGLPNAKPSKEFVPNQAMVAIPEKNLEDLNIPTRLPASRPNISDANPHQKGPLESATEKFRQVSQQQQNTVQVYPYQGVTEQGQQHHQQQMQGTTHQPQRQLQLYNHIQPSQLHPTNQTQQRQQSQRDRLHDVNFHRPPQQLNHDPTTLPPQTRYHPNPQLLQRQVEQTDSNLRTILQDRPHPQNPQFVQHFPNQPRMQYQPYRAIHPIRLPGLSPQSTFCSTDAHASHVYTTSACSMANLSTAQTNATTAPSVISTVVTSSSNIQQPGQQQYMNNARNFSNHNQVRLTHPVTVQYPNRPPQLPAIQYVQLQSSANHNQLPSQETNNQQLALSQQQQHGIVHNQTPHLPSSATHEPTAGSIRQFQRLPNPRPTFVVVRPQPPINSLSTTRPLMHSIQAAVQVRPLNASSVPVNASVIRIPGPSQFVSPGGNPIRPSNNKRPVNTDGAATTNQPPQKIARTRETVPASVSNPNGDCEVLIVQRKQTGLPIIQSVEGSSVNVPSASRTSSQTVSNKSTVVSLMSNPNITVTPAKTKDSPAGSETNTMSKSNAQSSSGNNSGKQSRPVTIDLTDSATDSSSSSNNQVSWKNPLTCQVCNQTFNTQALLKNHLVSHLKNTFRIPPGQSVNLGVPRTASKSTSQVGHIAPSKNSVEPSASSCDINNGTNTTCTASNRSELQTSSSRKENEPQNTSGNEKANDLPTKEANPGTSSVQQPQLLSSDKSAESTPDDNTGTEFFIPVFDLRRKDVLRHFESIGITQFIPAASLKAASKMNFAMPILSTETLKKVSRIGIPLAGVLNVGNSHNPFEKEVVPKP